jgi:hypothetical protein
MTAINLENFQKKHQEFKALDYANSYYGFWRRKTQIELEGGSILDKEHLTITFRLLSKAMKSWQAYRPMSAVLCLQRLENKLPDIIQPYEKIRGFSLLDFDKAPSDELKTLWNKLGCVKEDDGAENNPPVYFAVAITKPLMFLWGQTPAFDEYVRNRMPVMNSSGLETNRWSFSMWYGAMRWFQDWLRNQPEFLSYAREISAEEFGSKNSVPFGQFIDLNYWVSERRSRRGNGM